MSRYCLDTSAYSRFMRGDATVVEALDRAPWIGVPTITMGELRAGFLQGRRSEANEDELQRFLSHPAVHVLPVDAEASRHFALIVGDLRKAGTPLATNDIWIAAVAAGAGATVLTFDRHFDRMVRVGATILEG